MINANLLYYKKNVFSQNGEDGIIERIFEIIGTSSKICCEFGAWDGIHFSNTRKLIIDGWTGILIESDEKKFKELTNAYKNNDKVFCINKLVDTSNNSLSAICSKMGLDHLIKDLDFLSIDIDGLDYEILANLDVYPRVICIEVNAGHSPYNSRIVEREIAKNNVGQPLHQFTKKAEEKGYGLVCYNGNAFYIRKDVLNGRGNSISDEKAYADFLDCLPAGGREWLFLVNRGSVPPFYRFKNPFLNRRDLGIRPSRVTYLIIKNFFKQSIRKMYRRYILKKRCRGMHVEDSYNM